MDKKKVDEKKYGWREFNNHNNYIDIKKDGQKERWIE